MKVDELMVGNWVLFCGDTYQICKEDFSANYDFEPILLTPEILEKSNLEKIVFKYWGKKEPQDIITYSLGEASDMLIELSENQQAFCLVDNVSDWGDDGYNANWLCDIKYVHELQHIIKVFKIEKNIIV